MFLDITTWGFLPLSASVALTANFPRYFAFLISFQSHDARKASLCKVSIDINPFLTGWLNLTKQAVHWPSVCTFSTTFFFFFYKYLIFPTGVFVQQSKAILVGNQWYFKKKFEIRSVATSSGLDTTPWQVIHLQFCYVSVAVAVCCHPLIHIHASGWKEEL